MRDRVATGANFALAMEDSTMWRLDDPAGLTRGEFERLSCTVMGGSPLYRI